MQLPQGMTQQQFQTIFTRFIEVKRSRELRALLSRKKFGWALRGEVDKFGSVKEAVHWMRKAEEARENAEFNERYAERLRLIEEDIEEEEDE